MIHIRYTLIIVTNYLKVIIIVINELPKKDIGALTICFNMLLCSNLEALRHAKLRKVNAKKLASVSPNPKPA